MCEWIFSDTAQCFRVCICASQLVLAGQSYTLKASGFQFVCPLLCRGRESKVVLLAVCLKHLSHGNLLLCLCVIADET